MGKPLGAEWIEKAQELNRLVLASPLTKDLMVYRATLDGYLTPHFFGSELVYPAFMSTTCDIDSVERHFSTPSRNVVAALLEIECNKGHPALNMELDQSFGGHERELLLPMRAKFAVLSVKEVVDKVEMAKIVSCFYVGCFSAVKIYRLKYLGAA